MAKDTGWTRTPNAILEAMPDMTKAELKLTAVLVRVTYGYHKESVRMTYDEMVTATELSRGGLSNAIDAVVNRGFFKRGNKSMWYTNSLTSELKSIDESLTSRLKSTEQTEEIVQPVDQNSLPNRPNYTGLKEKENNIYIPPDPPQVVQLKTAIAQTVKTPMWEKTEKEYDDAAIILMGWDATPESMCKFSDWWKINGWHQGLPELKTLLREYRNYLDGVVNKNGNGANTNTVKVRTR